MLHVTPTTREAYRLLHEGSLALARAEQQGMRIDVDYCKRMRTHLTRKMKMKQEKFEGSKLYRQWKHIYGSKTKLTSNDQLAHILYNVRKLDPPKLTDSGKGSTDEDTLSRLDIPEIKDLLDLQRSKRVRDTYLGAFVREQVDGYIHPFFNLHVAITYRSSSDHPNFQNIPIRDELSKRICRRAIFPRPGHQLLESDFSGIEVRISQCYHKDPNMYRYIVDPTTDMHRDMAIQLYLLDYFDKSIPVHKNVLRQGAKNSFVFPQFYGDFYGNCARGLAIQWGKLPLGRWRKGQGIELPEGHISDHLISKGIRSFDDFEEHVKRVESDFWGNRFKVYEQWKTKWWRQYQKRGYFDMLSGFRSEGVFDKKQTINAPIQGPAFHCLLWTFIEVDRIAQEERWDSKLIGQIHDSIIADVHPAERDHVAETIHRVGCIELPKVWSWINVPLEMEADICDVDTPWSEKHPYEYKLVV
jgi:DNA polymerase-1